MKIFLEVKKFKKLFCGQPPLLQYFLDFIETVLHLEQCFEKVRIYP